MNKQEQADRTVWEFFRARFPKDPPAVIDNFATVYKGKLGEKLLSASKEEIERLLAEKLARNEDRIGQL